jgi:predicted nucleic-acid-binding protein
MNQNVIAPVVSTFIPSQFPEFIREGSPNFVAFVAAYYEFLEQAGLPSPNCFSTVYQSKQLLDYHDLDSTLDQFLHYYVNDFLPFFPSETALDERKLIKVARQFYQQKGTPQSIQFLFRVLYGKDADIYFPKLNILKTSDGKWTQPQALRLLLSANNLSFDTDQLVQRIGVGSNSAAQCVIEAVNKTVDPNLGFEIVEVFVSNITKPFDDLESLIVNYGTDSNGNALVFEQKIIAALSNITIDPNNRGLKYNTGNPVVLTGGLEPNDPSAQKAVAYVGNVTTGSITSLNVAFGGYDYRPNPNTIVTFINDPSDANGAGAQAIVSSVDVTNAIYVQINTDSIYFKQNETIGNTTLQFANNVSGNLNTPMNSLFSYANIQFAPIKTMNVISGGGGYSHTPTLSYDVTYNTDYSDALALAGDPAYNASVQSVDDLGMFAAVQVLNGGSGYSNTTDVIIAQDAIGSNAVFTMITGANGAITAVNVAVRGNGYFVIPPLAVVNSASLLANGSHTPPAGVGAVLQGFGFGQGANVTIGVNKIGQIIDFNLVNRGFDYITDPTVSLRIQDVIVNPLPINDVPLGDAVIYQGANVNTAIYVAYVDSLSSNNVLRLYNYRGAINVYQNLVMTLIGNRVLNVTVNTAATSNVKTYGNGQAKANAVFLNGLINYPGFYLGTDGFLSADQYIQDANTYHNYSYQIIVEKALGEYKALLMQIAHPAGTSMLGKYVIPASESFNAGYSTDIKYISPPIGTINVGSNGIAYGTGTSFTTYANVGDLLVYNTSDTSHQLQTKVITAIANNTQLTLESNTQFLYETGVSFTANANTVFSNANDFVGNVAVGDRVFLSVANAVTGFNVVAVGSNQLGLDANTIANGSSQMMYVLPTFNIASYQIISTKQV